MNRNTETEAALRRKKKRQKRRRELFHKIFFFSATAFLLGLICGKVLFASGAEGSEPEKGDRYFETAESRKPEDQKSGAQEIPWELTLVNYKNFIDGAYAPELSEIEDNYYFDRRAAESLKKMLRDGRSAGMDLVICSAYRTKEKQTSLYENKVKRLQAEGLSYEEAYEEAKTEVAYPGTSEHQLGLAVDLVARSYQQLDEAQERTKEAKWLKENCWKYGFILRYPPEKTEETGVIYEPWHYRYVGMEAAEEITENNLCLEEYLEKEGILPKVE